MIARALLFDVVNPRWLANSYRLLGSMSIAASPMSVSLRTAHEDDRRRLRLSSSDGAFEEAIHLQP